jgi:hypothetical protein
LGLQKHWAGREWHLRAWIRLLEVSTYIFPENQQPLGAPSGCRGAPPSMQHPSHLLGESAATSPATSPRPNSISEAKKRPCAVSVLHLRPPLRTAHWPGNGVRPRALPTVSCFKHAKNMSRSETGYGGKSSGGSLRLIWLRGVRMKHSAEVPGQCGQAGGSKDEGVAEKQAKCKEQ